MPEFRQNRATKEWVVLAPERGQRPSDYAERRPERRRLPDYVADCPFCLGNEKHTEAPLLVIEKDARWQVRVVPNKYAPLQPDLATTRTRVGSFLAAKGFGIAEVVVEHPRHNVSPALMAVDEVADVLRACRRRQVAMSGNEKINLVTIFRNYGARAGTSLEHPHSQIIATPIVPPHVRYPMEQAVMHYDKYGSCVHCDMVAEEVKQEERILHESGNFVAFCPFASRSPFEIRVYPTRHQASFVLLDEEEAIVELAELLQNVLARLHRGLGDPDYNYIIRSSPVGDEDTRHLHWYMVIVPKMTIPAGFEIGSGIYINTVAPEDAAAFLRQV